MEDRTAGEVSMVKHRIDAPALSLSRDVQKFELVNNVPRQIITYPPGDSVGDKIRTFTYLLVHVLSLSREACSYLLHKKHNL